MLMRLAGGRMMDPAHGIDGQARDVYVRDGRIIDPPADAAAAQTLDVSGRIVHQAVGADHRRGVDSTAGGLVVEADIAANHRYPQRLTGWFAKHRAAAGMPTGSLHILRHTAATLALTATPPVPLHVITGRLGDDPKTVLATYAHLLPHSDAMAA